MIRQWTVAIKQTHLVQSRTPPIQLERMPSYLYYKGDCVCVFFIGGHTVGPSVLKFGMEDHIYPREVIGYILFGYPNPGGQALKTGFQGLFSPNRAFLGNFPKTKVEGRP